MSRSREAGSFDPEAEKPKREIKVIKRANLDIKLQDFNKVPNIDARNQHGEIIPQEGKDWADDLRAIVKLKQDTNSFDKEAKAREEFDDLFKK